MAKDFHNKPFNEETILKLQIFRGYTRQWLPVFLSRKTFDSVNIFDFLAGPGKDSNGTEGSPLIIIDEIKKYFTNNKAPLAENVSIRLFLNDSDPDKILLLGKEINTKDETQLEIKINNKDFQEAFDSYGSLLESTSAAKLVILDQSGIKQITSDVFVQLIEFPCTDFMFFISSSTLKRFITVEKVGQYFPSMSEQEVNAIPVTDIHRFVCSYYQKLIPSGREYYLAPFSIKKGPNIYGIIFGSGHLLGLEKFLRVCWNQDSVSGEANYDIDDDIIRNGETLFPEWNVSKKRDLFRKQLVSFLNAYKSNKELYKFTLEQGCLPTHAVEILKELLKEGRLEVDPADTRKRSFYVNWPNYRRMSKAKFRIIK
jgi:three-Cys-motif partner protein